MKTVVIFLVLFIASATATDDFGEKLGGSIVKCIQVLKPSQATMEKIQALQGFSDKKVGAFVACVLKEFDVLDGNKINAERLVSVISESHKLDDMSIKAVTQLVKTCKKAAEVSKDPSVVAGAFVQCVLQILKSNKQG